MIQDVSNLCPARNLAMKGLCTHDPSSLKRSAVHALTWWALRDSNPLTRWLQASTKLSKCVVLVSEAVAFLQFVRAL